MPRQPVEAQRACGMGELGSLVWHKGFSSYSSLINMHTKRTALLSVILFFVYMYIMHVLFVWKGGTLCGENIC